MATGALAVAFLPEGLRAQRLTYSTHDWQLQAPTSQIWSTSWSDVKVPGNGLTYSLGTTWTDHTDENNFALTFSGVGGMGPSSPTKGPGIADGAGAIAAVLQVTDAQQNIVWQRFFHGDGGSQFPLAVTSTHGRGISVFPGATDLETRIAICGETQDQRLPLSSLQLGAESGLLQSHTAGFVAVYNGRGDLLWTYLIYGNDKNASTAITDVAIHVDNRTDGLDVVTYCGLSANGSYDPTPSTPTATPLTPENPFPFSGTSTCDLYASGGEVNHPFNPSIRRPAARHPNLQPTAMNPRPMDGVRTVIDTSPDGVALSDGTGDPALGWAPVGNGGTTPACALSSFGSVVGATPAALNRMFLDYEGEPSSGAPVSLLVDRPPPASWVVVSSWQVGVPSPTPVYLPDHDVEVWVVPGSGQATVPMLPTGGSTRQVFTGMPQGFSYLVQYVCLLAVPLTGTPCTGTDLTWAVTPAMLFSY